MIRACVLDFKDNWEDHIPLVEFSYDKNYQDSIDIAPYESLYGRKCRPLSVGMKPEKASYLGLKLWR